MRTDPLVPYVLTYVSPGLCHALLLPAAMPLEDMATLALLQAARNDLPCCLSLGWGQNTIFEGPSAGHARLAASRIRSVVDGKLHPGRTLEEDDDVRHRRELLRARAARDQGFLLGDPAKGGRPPAPGEAERLQGLQLEGVPKGLSRCQKCGEWRGECLDRAEQATGFILPVSCACENRNLCAKCLKPLFRRKLNSNTVETDGRVWFVPGFAGLEHVCPPEVQTRREPTA